MDDGIKQYHQKQTAEDQQICETLYKVIEKSLPTATNKVWHGAPVWFIDDNPIVGYSKQKPGIRLMFWSGKSFGESGLNVVGEKFKDASVFYNAIEEISTDELKGWLEKSKDIQWDYKNIMKKKGKLDRIK